MSILFQNNDDQFIFPEGAGRQRGRFELMFSQIGGSVFAGNQLYSFCCVYNAWLIDSVKEDNLYLKYNYGIS